MTSGGKGVKNHAASVRARLLQHAKRHGQDFQRILTHYAIERLLFRLGKTDGAQRYVLKGAMLFATWPEYPFRATGDLDLLGHGDPTPGPITELFSRVCEVDFPADGIVFDPATLQVDAVREDKKYQGIRATLAAALDGARIPMQVDIGFGDRIHPPATQQTFPCLLPDLPPPSLLMYPPETVVAEKFEAMISLGEGNTRLKDFYDLWTMTRVFSFELSSLVEAVGGTLRRRETTRPADVPTALSDSFATIVETKGLWRGFLRRAPPPVSPPPFPELQIELRRFFGPVIVSLAAPEGARGRWDKDAGAWTEP